MEHIDAHKPVELALCSAIEEEHSRPELEGARYSAVILNQGENTVGQWKRLREIRTQGSSTGTLFSSLDLSDISF